MFLPKSGLIKVRHLPTHYKRIYSHNQLIVDNLSFAVTKEPDPLDTRDIILLHNPIQKGFINQFISRLSSLRLDLSLLFNKLKCILMFKFL
ncbi:hypothetical protein DDR33_11630 [Pararcticibacter amylolyticus]|uniref:Uncharacterized protein n=1 Tax=Pararcticibacter amylolyticus TaxID=2173175 RepID=A0A2U2PGZ7_9SPHI|nr:hypothetical protein DDR33_11630 [Pararcticibacter amylolyticus]